MAGRDGEARFAVGDGAGQAAGEGFEALVPDLLCDVLALEIGLRSLM
ncbi:hypothetical protein ACIP88_25745 [Streptomyces uncialis]